MLRCAGLDRVLPALCLAALALSGCGSSAPTKTAGTHSPTPALAGRQASPVARRSGTATPGAARSPGPSVVPPTGGAPNPGSPTIVAAVTSTPKAAAATPSAVAAVPASTAAGVQSLPTSAAGLPGRAGAGTQVAPAGSGGAPLLATPRVSGTGPAPRTAPTGPSSAAANPTRPGGTVAAGQPDPAAQAALQAAVVQAADLPPGFRPAIASAGAPLFLGQTATYYARFTRGTGQASAPTVAVVLLGFADAQTASARMNSGRAQINSFLTSGGGQRVESLANAPAFGDETVALHVVRVIDAVGHNDGGYEILWRRGNVVAVVLETSNPEPASSADVAAIAQQQDDALAAAGQ